MAEYRHISKYIFSFMLGALVISIIGTFQREAIFILSPVAWYILPILLGGTVGILVRYWITQHRKNKMKGEILQEIVPAAVMTLDKNRIITGWNRKAEEITEYKKENVIGKKCSDVLCETCESGCEINGKIKEMQMGINCRIKIASGKILTVLKTSDTLVDDHGNLIILESFTDITSFIEAEKKLIIAKELAEKSNRLKSEFLAQMSHEIRTPINSVLSFASLIKEDVGSNMTDDMKDSFHMIEVGSNRIMRTIDLILDMAQLNTGTFDILPKYMMLIDEVVDPIFKDFHFKANKKNIEFNLIKQKPEFVIQSDPYVIGQIIVNLVDNAIKFTNKGEVILRVFEENGRLNIQVKDTGIGIGKEYQPKIYEPFSQEEQGYTRRYEGNGLGLSLVKKYCDLIGTEIYLESKIGIGTTFTLQFPESIMDREAVKK